MMMQQALHQEKDAELVVMADITLAYDLFWIPAFAGMPANGSLYSRFYFCH